MDVASIPKNSIEEQDKKRPENDGNQANDSPDGGHLERQAEVRLHLTEEEKAGGIPVLAEKVREAQQKYKDRLRSGRKIEEVPTKSKSQKLSKTMKKNKNVKATTTKRIG